MLSNQSFNIKMREVSYRLESFQDLENEAFFIGFLFNSNGEILRPFEKWEFNFIKLARPLELVNDTTITPEEAAEVFFTLAGQMAGPSVPWRTPEEAEEDISEGYADVMETAVTTIGKIKFCRLNGSGEPDTYFRIFEPKK